MKRDLQRELLWATAKNGELATAGVLVVVTSSRSAILSVAKWPQK